MKVYFSGSRYYKEEFEKEYENINRILVDNGFKVLNYTEKKIDGSKIVSEEARNRSYEEMVKLIDKCDFSVFEATFPSTIHVGHEITLAIEKGKPVIVLYKEEQGKEPSLFRGIRSDKIIWVSYTRQNLTDRLSEAVMKAKEIQDVRFNFFVSPKILTYLSWIAQKRKIPRSVFLRDLIEREMKKDKDFKSA